MSDSRPRSPREVAREVLSTEATAIHGLLDQLDDSFERAVELIQGTAGRVVCTGMGKSGHVARKIAATMASTGTPAQFVHPGEASHGDLGMIARGDAVIALSNSGKTPELSDIIAYTRRRNIPLIGITVLVLIVGIWWFVGGEGERRLEAVLENEFGEKL